MTMRTSGSTRRVWPWFAGGAAVLVAVAVAVVSWTMTAESSTSPAPTPSPSITLHAVDKAGQDARPADELASSPTETPAQLEDAGDETAGGAPAPVDDAAGQQAYDAGVAAVLGVVSQPAGETPEQRVQRLAGLFAAGSPTPAAPAPLDLADIGVASNGRVDAAGIAWAEPFDPGDGRIGILIAVTAQTFGVRSNSGVDTAWKDTSTQLWKVLLANDGAAWVPQVAYLADRPEPTGDNA